MTGRPHWIGFLLTGTLAWALILGLVWYSAILIPAWNLVLTCLAIGVPAGWIGWSAARRRLQRPVLLALAAYIGGAALAIAALQRVGPAVTRDLHHLIEAFLIHLVTGTLFVPAPDGGYQLFPVNLLWLALAGITASITAEMAAKRMAPGPENVRRTRATSPSTTPPSAAPSRAAARPRPRRRRAGHEGTGETNGDHLR